MLRASMRLAKLVEGRLELGIVRTELVGPFNDRQSSLVVFQNVERRSQQVKSIEQVWSQSYCLFEGLAGLQVAFQPEIAKAEIMPGVKRIGIQLDGTQQRTNGIREIAVLAI